MFADPDDKPHKISATYTSRVAEIFQVILKAMGIELSFVNDETELKTLDNTKIADHNVNGKIYFCTDYQAFLIQRICDIRDEIMEVFPLITKNDLIRLMEDELRHNKYIIDDVDVELGDLAAQVEAEVEYYYDKFQKEKLAEQEAQKALEAPKEEVKEEVAEETT